MSKIYNVLFLCNGNSARSILAEAILNKEGADRFYAYSAGSHPDSEIHPAAAVLLGELEYPMDQIRPESWDDFAREDSPRLDFVFTLADETLGETCPVWPGQPISAHWGIEDPAGSGEEDSDRAFRHAYHALQRRIRLFLALPLDSIDEMSLQARLGEIGASDQESSKAA
ncbi:MAG TPA: arsenate reductase ArsC [Sphingomicrobium sp.]|jgi:protein-tyrosine-phosphatase|nr:arsenate reductase ArsC [Sphingomicrobium sp.]